MPGALLLDLQERSARFLGHAQHSVLIAHQGVPGSKYTLSDFVVPKDFATLGTQNQSDMQLRECVESGVLDAIDCRLEVRCRLLARR